MSNLEDLARDVFDENGGWCKINGEILGALADFSGALGIAQLGINLVTSFLAKDEEAQKIIAAIQKDFQDLKAFIAAEDKLARMRDVDLGMKDAVAVFQQLPANMAILSSLSSDFIQTQIQTCLAAVLFFAENEDKWEAVAQSVPSYSDAWSGSVAPDVTGNGLVFNYTYTLPQYLRSISILLTAIGSLAPTSLANYQSSLSICLTRLENVYDTIVSSGIVGTRVPNAADIGSVAVPEPPDHPFWQSPWYGSGRPAWPYGAVERYSAASQVSSYFTDFIPYELDSDRTYVASLLNLIRLRIEQRKKTLYLRAGMPSVRQSINYLRGLLGRPPLAGPLYEDWTLSQALNIMQIPAPGSVRALLAAVQAAPPFAAGWAFTGDPTSSDYDTPVPGQPLPPGLRGLLTA